MGVEWNGQALLDPISAEQPCGESLEDTPLLFSFDALRLFGQSRSPEAPPDPDEDEKEKGKAKAAPEWGQIKLNAIDALNKSKDLRVLSYAGAALLRTDGLGRFFETLTVAAHWLDTYWAQVYPALDEDALFRRNALNCFADPMAVLDRVWRIPLVQSRQHGRFGLRDIDIVAGLAAAGPTEARPDEAAINAAFHDMPLDELKALERGVTAAVAAVTNIDARMRSEGGPEMAPDFEALSGYLARMNRALRSQLAIRGEGTEGETVSAGDAPSGTVAVGAIKSRQDAIRALDAVAEYFRRNEPSSPIPMFLERAKRLVAKDFLEVLADIVPEALDIARAAGGLRDQQQ